MTKPKPKGWKSSYNAEYQAKAEDYLENHDELQGDPVPSGSGMCRYLGITRPTLSAWCRQFEDFKAVMDAVSVKQESMLISGGLQQRYSSVITKLMLSNHGYSDKVQSDHTSSDGSMSPSRIELVAKHDDSDD